ncbi:hypothetical protein Tco_0364741 [Tanacetum coccineum]
MFHASNNPDNDLYRTTGDERGDMPSYAASAMRCRNLIIVTTVKAVLREDERAETMVCGIFGLIVERGGGRGLKEKHHGLSTISGNSTGSVNEFGYGGNGDGNGGDHSLGNGGTLKPTANVNATVSPTVPISFAPTSYAKLFTGDKSKKSMNFCTLITQAGNGAAVIVPVECIRAISEQFANTAYGFFLEKRVTYLVVANYEECPKNMGVGEAKNLKKPSETPRGVPKNVKPTKEVSKSNPFDVLNSVENDVDLGTNRGASNLASQEANSSGSSFWNVSSSSPITTPIVEKIDKIERLIIDGKVTFVNDEGKTLENVYYSRDYDSEDEVASVDNEIASFFAKKDGYGTNSLLEQWEETYKNADYDYNPYDDDMYEGQEVPEKFQSICDNLDIKVRGRKKK